MKLGRGDEIWAPRKREWVLGIRAQGWDAGRGRDSEASWEDGVLIRDGTRRGGRAGKRGSRYWEFGDFGTWWGCSTRISAGREEEFGGAFRLNPTEGIELEMNYSPMPEWIRNGGTVHSRGVNSRGRIRVGGCVGSGCGSYGRGFGATVGSWRG